MTKATKWLAPLLLFGLMVGCEGGESKHFVGKSSIELGFLDRLKALDPMAVDTFPDGHVREIKLLETKISEAALVAIGSAPKLMILLLGKSDIDDDGLRHLSGLTSLETLGLMHTRVTDAGMQHVGKLTGLRFLILGHTAVTDAGLAHLGGLQNLEKLALTGLEVTDDGMKHLTGLEKLTFLELSDTRVTDRGVALLNEALPDLRTGRNYELPPEVADRMQAVPTE